MAVYFFDSSALVKHYLIETGSGWVGDIMDLARRNVIHAAAIAEVEVVAALSRRSKMPGAEPRLLSAALSRFRIDFDAHILAVQITSELLSHAASLAERHTLRGYDAVQLAAAIRVNAEYDLEAMSLVVVSADEELNAASVAEGLHVENPNLHP